MVAPSVRIVFCTVLVATLVAATPVNTPSPSQSSTPAGCVPLTKVGTVGIEPDGREVAAGTSGTATRQDYVDAKGSISSDLTPPIGFDPDGADAETLMNFGYPPRPNDVAALDRWESAYGMPSKQVPPTGAGCERPTSNTTKYPSSWSGREVNSQPFTDVQGEWKQPTTVSWCTVASDRSIWVGIGGQSPGAAHFMQDGTNTNGWASVTAWYQTYGKENEIDKPVPAVSHEDLFFAETTYNTINSGTVYYYLLNVSTGEHQTYTESNVSQYYDHYGTEWIDERQTVNHNVVDLMKSNDNTSWYGEEANGSSAGLWPGSLDEMTANGGPPDPVSNPVLMVPHVDSDSSHHDTWYSCPHNS